MHSKKFPNGISSYLETHYLISIALDKLIKNEEGFAWERYLAQGSGGLYELAEELTDEFERTNKNEDWIDKEYLDEIDSFIESKNVESKNIIQR